MGNFSSQETNSAVSSFIDITNTAIVNISNNASSNCSSTQSFRLHTGLDPRGGTCPFFYDGGGIASRLDGVVSCTLSSENRNTITTDFQNNISTIIDTWIKQQLEQSNGWLATGLSFGFAGISTTEEMKTQLTSLLNTNITSSCVSFLDQYQEQNIWLCGYYKNVNIDFSQSGLATSITSCINNNITKAYSSNSVIQEFVTKTDQEMSQKNAGLFDWIVIVIVGLVIISVISGMIYYFTSPPPSSYPYPYPRPGINFSYSSPPYSSPSIF